MSRGQAAPVNNDFQIPTKEFPYYETTYGSQFGYTRRTLRQMRRYKYVPGYERMPDRVHHDQPLQYTLPLYRRNAQGYKVPYVEDDHPIIARDNPNYLKEESERAAEFLEPAPKHESIKEEKSAAQIFLENQQVFQKQQQQEQKAQALRAAEYDRQLQQQKENLPVYNNYNDSSNLPTQIAPSNSKPGWSSLNQNDGWRGRPSTTDLDRIKTLHDGLEQFDNDNNNNSSLQDSTARYSTHIRGGTGDNNNVGYGYTIHKNGHSATCSSTVANAEAQRVLQRAQGSKCTLASRGSTSDSLIPNKSYAPFTHYSNPYGNCYRPNGPVAPPPISGLVDVAPSLPQRPALRPLPSSWIQGAGSYDPYVGTNSIYAPVQQPAYVPPIKLGVLLGRPQTAPLTTCSTYDHRKL